MNLDAILSLNNQINDYKQDIRRAAKASGGNYEFLDADIINNFQKKLYEQADLFDKWTNSEENFDDFMDGGNGSEFEMFHFNEETYLQDLKEFAGAYVDKFDDDKNGDWNLKEFTKMASNDEKYLSADALNLYTKAFNALDIDGNGVVSKDEYSVQLAVTDLDLENYSKTGDISSSLDGKFTYDNYQGLSSIVDGDKGFNGLKTLKTNLFNTYFNNTEDKKLEYLNSEKDTITMGLSILAGNSVNLDIVNALTDGLIEYFSNGSSFTTETVPELIDRDFKNYLDEKYPDVAYTNEDLNNLKNSLYGVLVETSDGKVDLNAFNTIVKDYENNINNKEANTINLINDFNTKKAGLSVHKSKITETYDKNQQFLARSKNFLIQQLGDEKNYDIVKTQVLEKLADLMINSLFENGKTITQEDIPSIINDKLAPKLTKLQSESSVLFGTETYVNGATDENLKFAENILKNFVNKYGNNGTLTQNETVNGLNSRFQAHFNLQRNIDKVNNKFINIINDNKNLLTLTNQPAKGYQQYIPGTIVDKTTKYLFEYLASGNYLKEENVDNWVDNNLKSYLDKNGQGYSTEQLNNVKTIVKQFIKQCPNHDETYVKPGTTFKGLNTSEIMEKTKFTTSLSAQDVFKSLQLGEI